MNSCICGRYHYYFVLMAAQAPGYPIYAMSRVAAAQPELSGEEAVARQPRENGLFQINSWLDTVVRFDFL